MFPRTRSSCGSAIANRTLPCLLAWIASAAAFAISSVLSAQVRPNSSPISSPPTVIVVGFVGGFVHSDDDRHPEVQLVQRLSKLDTPALHAVIFENRQQAKAQEQIVRWLDTNHDGRLSDEEKQRARIILLGHSWGGSAVIRLANELNKSAIPVLLTIQLDSINKGPGNDCVIPPNVAQALNFYQTHGLVHGCQALRPIDANRTRIVGNFRFEYAALPPACNSFSWFDRHILKTHNAMECDSHVWSLVEEQIRTQFQGSSETNTTTPKKTKPEPEPVVETSCQQTRLFCMR